MTLRRSVPLLLALVLAVSAAPAGAANIAVDDPGNADDTIANGVCDVDGPSTACTLRAALREAEANDIILFAHTVTTITVPDADPLPPVSARVEIRAEFNCAVSVPCVQLRYQTPTAPNPLLDIEAANVVVIGLSMTNASVAIQVDQGGFQLYDSWMGLTPDGTIVPNTVHAFVLPSGQSATFMRNRFAGGLRGIDVVGANNVLVQANRFGYQPGDVASDAARIHTAIEIASATTPEDPSVGAVVGGPDPDPATRSCIDPCNLFSGSPAGGAAIRLAPDPGDIARAPVAGAAVEGNYIGVPATGTTCPGVTNAGAGILVGGGDNVTIGGDAKAEGNVIGCTGGSGIVAGQGAGGLLVENNDVGLMPDGATAAPFGAAAVDLGGSGMTILQNRIGGTPLATPAIRLQGQGVLAQNIVGTAAVGGEGILVDGPSTTGSTVRANIVMGAGGDGIRVARGSSIVVDSNAITSPGEDGIQVGNATPALAPSAITVGDVDLSDGATRLNTITGAGADAIRLLGDGTDGVDLGVNLGAAGSDPTDLFVDLVGTEGPGNTADGPSAGLAAPTAILDGTSLTGAAAPGAKVRVFRIDGEELDRADAFLGEAAANATSGAYSFTLAAPLAAGQRVAVHQTTADGSSELALATPRTSGGTGNNGGGGGGGGGGGTPPGNQPTTPPGPVTPPGPTGPLGPTAADEALAARRNLDRIVAALRRARLRGLARRRRLAVDGIEALRAGTLRFTATARSGRRGRAVTVLRGTLRFTAAGRARITVRTTAQGRRLARRSRRASLRARVRFAPAGGAVSEASRRVAVRR